MKRIMVLITAAIMVVVVAGCGVKEVAREVTTTQTPVENGVADGKDVVIDVDVKEEKEKREEKKEDDGYVTITIPSELIGEGVTQESLDEKSKEEKWLSATINEDGTATLKMDKSKHVEMMGDLKNDIDEFLEREARSSYHPDYVSITANDDYSEFTILTKSDGTNASDLSTNVGVLLWGEIYGFMNGSGDRVITIKYVNEETGNVIYEESR